MEAGVAEALTPPPSGVLGQSTTEQRAKYNAHLGNCALSVSASCQDWARYAANLLPIRIPVCTRAMLSALYLPQARWPTPPMRSGEKSLGGEKEGGGSSLTGTLRHGDRHGDDGHGPVLDARGAESGNGPAGDEHVGRVGGAANQGADEEEGKEGDEGPLLIQGLVSCRDRGSSLESADLCLEVRVELSRQRL